MLMESILFFDWWNLDIFLSHIIDLLNKIAYCLAVDFHKELSNDKLTHDFFNGTIHLHVRSGAEAD